MAQFAILTLWQVQFTCPPTPTVAQFAILTLWTIEDGFVIRNILLNQIHYFEENYSIPSRISQISTMRLNNHELLNKLILTLWQVQFTCPPTPTVAQFAILTLWTIEDGFVIRNILLNQIHYFEENYSIPSRISQISTMRLNNHELLNKLILTLWQVQFTCLLPLPWHVQFTCLPTPRLAQFPILTLWQVQSTCPPTPRLAQFAILTSWQVPFTCLPTPTVAQFAILTLWQV